MGPRDGPGEESFDVMVCTPSWLSRTLLSKGPLVGRHFLILEQMDLSRVKSFLKGEVRTWTNLPGPGGGEIGRIGMWEFEDCIP
jgi:hypothetical protein